MTAQDKQLHCHNCQPNSSCDMYVTRHRCSFKVWIILRIDVIEVYFRYFEHFMYICCWPTYLLFVRSGDTNKKYNFVINHFLTHSSSPNIDRAPYTVARLYTKRTRLVADKLYSWYFLLFSVICANCDVFGMLMAANIGFRWAAYFRDRKVKDITRTGASSHKGVKYVFSSRFPSALYCTQCHLPSIIREPP